MTDYVTDMYERELTNEVNDDILTGLLFSITNLVLDIIPTSESFIIYE